MEGRRYAGPDDFADLIEIKPVELSRNGTAPAVSAAFVLDAAAEPPFDRWLALMENEPKFKQSWERKRRDFQDKSASAYNMSLISFAVATGWSDQEIVNLCVAWRRKHAEDLKLHRADWYAASIAKARADAGQRSAIVSLTEGASDADRTGVLELVSRMLGVPVGGWIQHGRERARYTLQLADGREVAIGPAEAVFDPAKFRTRLYDATNHGIPDIKRVDWINIANALGRIAEVVENAEVSRRGTLSDWLRSYIADVNLNRERDLPLAIQQRDPFLLDGDLWVYARLLRKHIILDLMEQIEVVDLHDALRSAGFARRVKAGRLDDGRFIKARYWAGPAHVLDDDEADVPARVLSEAEV